MVDIDKLCPGCMQHLKDSNTTCPHCGYPEKHLTVKDSLPVFSILAGKYLLGAPLGKGGFGITYIAMHLPDEKMYFRGDTAPSASASSVFSFFPSQRTDNLVPQRLISNGKPAARQNPLFFHGNVFHLFLKRRRKLSPLCRPLRQHTVCP